MCRIPCTCRSERAGGGLEELDLGEELEQANVEELEQANVQDPSHLSVETSCRDLAEGTATQMGPRLELT